MPTHVNQAPLLALIAANGKEDNPNETSRRYPWVSEGPDLSRERASKALLQQRPSKLFHTEEEPSHRPEVPDSQLHRLPTEIFFEIKSYLNISSKLALTHTCQKLRQMTDVYIGDLFPPAQKYQNWAPTSAKPEREAAMREERFVFNAMLERDGTMNALKRVCSSCKKTHEISLFTEDALQESPLVRKCRGHEGRLWICPHRAWDYTQIQEALARNGAEHGSCNCGVIVYTFTNWSLGSVRLEYTLMTSQQRDRLDTQKVIKILKVAKIPFCPHLRSDDPSLVDNFHPGNSGFWGSFYARTRFWDSQRKVACRCHICWTTVRFGMRYSDRYIASVERKVGTKHGTYPVTSVRWIRNLS